jgi:regulator of cell morphogenesis and NO signaling
MKLPDDVTGIGPADTLGGSMDDWPLDSLMGHIVQFHHAHVRRSLTRLELFLNDVVATEGHRDPRLQTLAGVFREVASQLLQHMEEEENVLFPAVRDLLQNGGRGKAAPDMAVTLAALEAEHAEAEDALAKARELTDDFTPPKGANDAYRQLLKGLAALDADLHQHAHKENDILFPRLRAYASGVCTVGD